MSNWLFHGNPKRFPIIEDLRDGGAETNWGITQHLDDVSIGDNAAIWVSGPKAGVYAVGYVADATFFGFKNSDWVNPKDRGARGNFCPLHLTDILADRPVLKPDLLAAGGFEKARVIRQPFAGNPLLLTDAEWKLINRLK